MSGYADRYPAVVAELARLRGTLGTDAAGNTLPALSPVDMIGVLGLYTRGLLAAIKRVADQIVDSHFVVDGVLDYSITSSNMAAFGAVYSITAERYLAGVGLAGAPWKRAVSLSDAELVKSRIVAGGSAPASSVTFEPAREGSYLRNDQAELVTFLHQAVTDYSKVVDAIAATLETYGDTPNKNAVTTFLKAIRPLGSDLDVLAENPPTTLVQDLKGALGAATSATGDALQKGGELAGKAAAEVGNLAGDVAASTLEGFFSRAGLLTMAIAAIVIYKVV